MSLGSKLKFISVAQGGKKLTAARRSHSHKCVQILYYMRHVAEPIKRFVLFLRDFTPDCWADLVCGRGSEDI